MDYNLAKKFIESLIFSASEPLDFKNLQKVLGENSKFDLEKILKELEDDYADRGIVLEVTQGKYFFKTSPVLEPFLKIETKKTRNLLRVEYSKKPKDDQELIQKLMGSDVSLRKEFISEKALSVTNLDI